MEMNVETNSSPTAPKPSKQTGWRIWWNLLRPHTLTAAFVPVFIGTAYAMQVGGINQIHLPLFPYNASCLSSHSGSNKHV
ncbi:hypothetical protein ACT7CU_18620 [Bacillus paranthracis]